MKLASILLLGFLSLYVLPSSGFAQEAEKINDTAAYIEAVDRSKDLAPEEQVLLWSNFLEEFPETSFRAEIEINLENLDRLIQETDPKRKKEARDTQLYQRAFHFSKSLSVPDQILMWRQFLEENPENLYRDEAQGILNSLRKSHPGSSKKKESTSKDSQRVVPVVPDLEFKDRKHAFILATFPGLLVPGIGHFYAADYTTFGLLAACRAGALGAMIPGFLKSNRPMIIAGAIIYAFTYVVDVGHAPLAVDQYNEELEIRSKEALKHPISEIPFLGPEPEALIAFSFSF